jgi:methionine sulfoxide reductase catalytic subunit
MLIKTQSEVSYSEITPKAAYLNRRSFLVAGGMAGAALSVGKLISGMSSPLSALAGTKLDFKKSDLSTHGEDLTPLKDITTYNNFYEFGTEKSDPYQNATKFKTFPWTVSVEGLVAKPQKFDVASIMKLAPLEERVFRMRCVEGWSMVIPWVGIPLNALVNTVKPQTKAKYVAFESLYDPAQMPGQRYPVLNWPYVEGLRLDEAMHPLATLVFGLYGETLPNQDGAPIRLVTPWKYGFKGIKSIVKIKFVEKQPPTSWNQAASNEYGFYSNVNPNVDHPRWSQAQERRIGEFRKRKTLMFNGYDDVARLYAGMDLKANY